MDTELISVIVPVYNIADRLEPCLKSLLAQDYQNLEILLINDGSTDESARVCRRFAERDPRFRLLEQKNGGVSSARNLGLSNCTGDYVAFVDGDDFVEPSYCSALIRAAKHDRADICSCNAFRYDAKDALPRCLPEDEDVVVSTACDYNYSRTDKNHMAVWCVLFRRKLLENLSFAEDIFLSEDILFFAQAVRKADKIVHIHKNLYHYLYYDDSSRHARFSPKMITDFESWQRICDLNADLPQVKASCYPPYMGRCLNIIRWYFFRFGIERETYQKALKGYRLCAKEAGSLYRNGMISSRGEVLTHKVFALLPAVYPLYYLMRYKEKS